MKKSTNVNRDQISLEISILQRISIHEEKDKSHIPDYLKYRGEGFMYFPCKELLPFLWHPYLEMWASASITLLLSQFAYLIS